MYDDVHHLRLINIYEADLLEQENHSEDDETSELETFSEEENVILEETVLKERQ